MLNFKKHFFPAVKKLHVTHFAHQHQKGVKCFYAALFINVVMLHSVYFLCISLLDV